MCGVACIGLNGGDAFKHSAAFSFQIATEDQAETDRYWNAIVGNGGRGERVRLVHGQMGLVVGESRRASSSRRSPAAATERSARSRR